MNYDDDPNFTAYALGELEGPQKERFEALVAADPQAHQVAQEIRAAAQVLGEDLRREANSWALHELWRAVQALRLRAAPPAPRWARRQWGLALAASLVLAGALVVVVLNRQIDRPPLAQRPNPVHSSFTFLPDLPAAAAVAIGITTDSGGVGHAMFVPTSQVNTAQVPLSASSAGYGLLQRTLEAGQLPSPASLRIEELINAFAYHDAPPAGDLPVAQNAEVGPCPWAPQNRLVRMAVTTVAGPATAPVARDASLVVELNPLRVRAFRLLGYESGGLGAPAPTDLLAGQTVTVLMELVLAEAPPPALRYQQPTAAAAAGELLTMRLRYRSAPNGPGRILELAVADSERTVEKTSGDFRFCAAVASMGLVLRQGPHKGTATLEQALALAEPAADDPPRRQFVDLVRKAQSLWKQS